MRANEYEPTILQLRSAGEIYPDWVTNHYMQLPKGLSPKIIALAQQITAQSKTPYDMADAITDYLRSNITYADSVQDPPPGMDPLDWFLFDSGVDSAIIMPRLKSFYCELWGISARMVVGFAQGEFDYVDHYVVRQRDSHAWPEVYFPGFGWVEFEPTASQPPLELPTGENLVSNRQAGNNAPNGLSTPDEESQVPAGENGAGSEQEPMAILLLRLVVRLVLIWTFIITIVLMYSSGTFDRILKAGQRVSSGLCQFL